MRDIYARHAAEKLGRKVRHGSRPRRRVVQRTRFSARQLDQLFERLRGHAWMHDHQQLAVCNKRNRREIATPLEGELARNLRSHKQAYVDEGERVAVRWRTRTQLEPDQAAGTGAIVDDHWLAPPLAEP